MDFHVAILTIQYGYLKSIFYTKKSLINLRNKFFLIIITITTTFFNLRRRYCTVRREVDYWFESLPVCIAS